MLGGRAGVSNPNLVESAIGRPYTGYYGALWKKAAALCQSMAGNHGFVDGNKRTTLLLVHTLIDRSGRRLMPVNAAEDIQKALEEIIFQAAQNALTFDQLGVWFKARIKLPPPLPVLVAKG